MVAPRAIDVQTIYNINQLAGHDQKTYGGFILNSEPVLRLMKSENSKRITGNCDLPKAVICLDSMGKVKLPCVIGNKADCSRCGCIIPFQIESIVKNKNICSLNVTRKLFT